MYQDGFCIGVGFSAEYHVTIDGVVIVKTIFLGLGAGDAFGDEGFKFFKLSCINFKIGVDANCFR